MKDGQLLAVMVEGVLVLSYSLAVGSSLLALGAPSS